MAGEEKKSYGSGYGKRPLWQWILIYVVIGGIVYALIYYFVFAKKGYNYNSNNNYNYSNQQTAPTSSAVQNETTINISNYAFSPASITVKVGDTVTWTNNDGVGHSVVADDNSWNTGVLTPGQSKSITFGKAGTFSYHCSIHPTMKGTVIVK